MNSEYDHVGVVVKDSPLGGLKLLEASSAEGVNTYPVVERLRGYYLAGYVDKIGIRKLCNFVAEQSKILDGITFLKAVKEINIFSIFEYIRNVSNGFNTRDDETLKRTPTMVRLECSCTMKIRNIFVLKLCNVPIFDRCH